MKKILMILYLFFLIACNQEQISMAIRGTLLATGNVEDFNCNQQICRTKIGSIKGAHGQYFSSTIEYIDLNQLVLKGDEMCLVVFSCPNRNKICKYLILWPEYKGIKEAYHSDDIWTTCDKSTVSDFFPIE
jgi:hypothetical protein